MAAKYVLKFYVTGQTPNSIKAIGNLKDILKNGLNDICTLEVIDVLENPQLAEEDKIMATPTLIKISPEPARRIIGDLSDKKKVLLGLDLTVEK